MCEGTGIPIRDYDKGSASLEPDSEGCRSTKEALSRANAVEFRRHAPDITVRAMRKWPALFRRGKWGAEGFFIRYYGQITWMDTVTACSNDWTLYETVVPAGAQYVMICLHEENTAL
ncbi:MAG: hypothetical protein K5657_05865, partial [Desulfovibrio sp.]|nr:hypothetical protein [Desulfovibrio sp.]